MAAGIALVPEDRRQQGLIMDFSIERNIALASLDSVRRGGLIPRGAERRFAKDWALRLQLKYGRLTNPVWTLSGGNQQKAVLAKWLARKPTLLIVDEPTRGIDVGTKAEVHRLLSELAAQGVAVLMISSELPEVLGMADRVVVLFEGRVTRRVRRGRRRPRTRSCARPRGWSRTPRDRARRRARRRPAGAGDRTCVAELLLRFRELGIVLALVLVVGATTIDNHLFLSATNVQQVLSGAAIIALLAIGETIVIITRNVDLSIGSVLGISAYATGSLYVHHPHVSLPSSSSSLSASALACGVVNGAVVTVARVPSLVVTLGTLYIIRGIDGAWAGGNQVNASMLPTSFNKIGYGTIAGVPYLGIIAIVAVVIATYAMRSFRTARDFYAIGSDPAAARLAGIPVGVARVPRVRPERRDRRPCRRGVAVVLRLGRCDRRRRLRVPGDRGGRRRRRRDLRRQRHGARSCARARCS